MTKDTLLLDAVRRAVAEPGEHRLFRAGKLAGLFPARTGAAADAAKDAVTSGLLETVRTDLKGKIVTEWVRVTPAGVAFVHDRDSPAVVLTELRDVVGAARTGVPAWLDGVRTEMATLSERFETQAAAILARLDALSERLDAAVRRAELTAPAVPNGLRMLVPWGTDALAYLDRRRAAGAAGPCPLGELFHAVRERVPDLTVPDFHAGMTRLHDARAVRLTGGADVPDPEFALFVGPALCSFAER